MKGRKVWLNASQAAQHTIKNADKILAAKDLYALSEHGYILHESLAKNGFYAELYNSQFEE